MRQTTEAARLCVNNITPAVPAAVAEIPTDLADLCRSNVRLLFETLVEVAAKIMAHERSVAVWRRRLAMRMIIPTPSLTLGRGNVVGATRIRA